jgi:hypothetical protein
VRNHEERNEPGIGGPTGTPEARYDAAAQRPDARHVASRLIRGGGSLLDWPPPGLRRLHGALSRANRYMLGGAIALGLPFVLLAAFGRDSGARGILASPVVTVSMAVVGLALFLDATFRLLVALRHAGKSARAGHGWGTILEVMLDRRGDHGALITGMREYTTLPAPERSALRRRRIVAGVAVTIAATAPAWSTILLLPIFTRMGDGGARLFAVTVLGTMSLLIGGATALRLAERQRLRPIRARLGNDPAPETFTRLALAWRASFEQVRAGQPFGADAGGRGAVLAAGVLLCALALLGSVVAWWTTSMTSITEINASKIAAISGFDARQLAAARLSAFRAPIDPAVTPERAGEAAHALKSFRLPLRKFERAPRQIAGEWTWIDNPPEVLGDPRERWPIRAIRQARRGFTPAQRAVLDSMARSPLIPEYEILGRAAAADVQSASWQLPLADTVAIWQMPVRGHGPLFHAGLALVARSALALAAGRVTDAERDLRTVVGAGFALMEDRLLIEALIGRIHVELGRDAFLALYEATGRTAEANGILREVAEALRTSSVFAQLNQSMSLRALTDSARKVFLNPATPTSVRWEIGVYGLSMAPCTDLHQVLFGADSSHRAVFAAARRTMVKTQTDSIIFDLGVGQFERRPPPRVGSQGLHRRAARAVDFLLGGHRVESCVAAAE